MADAVLWQILESVQTGIRSLTLAAMGSELVATVPSANIVIRKVKTVERSVDRGGHLDRVPGVIITPPSRTMMDPLAGTNARDDVDYSILCQIIDQDNDTRLTGLRTYLKWQEQIAKYFRNQGLSDVQNPEGYVWLGYVASVDNVDEKRWVRHRLFQAGIELHFISREPRGAT